MRFPEYPVPPSVVKKDRDIFYFFRFRNLMAKHDTADFVESNQHFPFNWKFPENGVCAVDCTFCKHEFIFYRLDFSQLFPDLLPRMPVSGRESGRFYLQYRLPHGRIRREILPDTDTFFHHLHQERQSEMLHFPEIPQK